MRVILTRFSNLLSPRKYFYRKKSKLSFSNDVKSKSIQSGDRVSVVKRISEEDIINFSKLTGDFNPIHTTSDRKVVHGALLNGYLSGVLGTKLPGPGAMIIKQEINYPKSCYADDTVEITVVVLSARKIIHCSYQIVANNDRIVLQGEGKLILSKS